MNIQQKDAKYIGRDTPAVSIEVIETEGNYVIARGGKKYIDFLMGWNVGNIGWGRKEVRQRLKKFDGPDYVNPFYLYKPWVELAETLATITPGKLTKTFRATGGTEAVEIAIQAAMVHTKRQKFISIEGSYHGHSIGAMSVGMSYFRTYFPDLWPESYKIDPPLDAIAAEKVEKELATSQYAAYISEPVICNLAVLIPETEFLQRVFRACKKYGTLFIMDEVATGFGRTGKLFATEHFKVEPDILIMAKGLTGGYGAMGATIMTEEVAKSMEFNFSFYSTFGWHPRNVEATLVNLEYLLAHKAEILKNVATMSSYFAKRLKEMNFAYPTEIRVKGLAIGLVCQKEGYLIDVMNRCIKKGLLVSELGKTMLTFFPALTIDQKTSKKGLDIFESSL